MSALHPRHIGNEIMRLKNLLSKKTLQGKPLLLFSVLTLCLAVAGCATNERRFKKGDLTIIYRHKTAGASELEDIELAHPVKISQKTLSTHLRSLAYTHNAILSKGKHIFSVEQVEEHSKILTRALKNVSPNKIIYFELDGDSGTIAGELFASDGSLNWKFDTIHGTRYSKNMLKGWGSTWRLIPRKGQTLFTSEKLLGRKTWDNWILSELDLPDTDKRKIRKKSSRKKGSKKRRAKTKKPAPTEIDPELETKLKFLKQLKDKDLIDDDEYKRKRKELLDQAF